MNKAIPALLAGILFLPRASAGPSSGPISGDDRILHLLNRITFGPRPGDVERVRQTGADRFIDEQLHPERIDDRDLSAQLAAFPSLNMSISAINRTYVPPNQIARELGLLKAGNAEAAQAGDPQKNPEVRKQVLSYYASHGLNPPQKLLQELQAQKIVRAVSSQRQLQEVMTDFWFNHFNVYWGKGLDKQLTTDYEMNAIRPHVLGKFKDLVMATAKSPAMLFYLDNAQSSSPDAKTPAMERLEELERRRLLTVNPRAQARLQEQIMRIRERMAQAKSAKARKPGIM